MSSPLQNNIVNLQNILNSINNLPEAGSSVNLPELTNPADASKVLLGYEFINENGIKITGTIPTNTETNLTVEGTTVIIPAGYYASQISKTVDGAESNTALLYEIGNQNIAVTGGWGSTDWSGGYYAVNAPTIDNSGMTISGKGEDTLTICGTKNKIDLRNISTLYVTVDQWTFMVPTAESAYFAVNSEKQAMNPATGYNMTAI